MHDHILNCFLTDLEPHERNRVALALIHILDALKANLAHKLVPIPSEPVPNEPARSPAVRGLLRLVEDRR